MAPPRDEVRASDVDRERTVERLREAAGEGRLSTVELEERTGAALAATTLGRLDGLVGDLPERHEPPRAPTGRAASLQPFLAVSVLLIAIWALTGAGYFWPVWPILGWGLCLPGKLLRSPRLL